MTVRTQDAIIFGEPPLEPYRASARTLCYVFGCSDYPEPHCKHCGSSYVAWVFREVALAKTGPEERDGLLEEVATWDIWPPRIEHGWLYPLINAWRNWRLPRVVGAEGAF